MDLQREAEGVVEREVTAIWTDSDWAILVDRIRSDRCTPFLGAGVAAGLLPLGKAVAKQLAAEHNYPFEEIDLVKISQFVAITYDSMYPKELLAKELVGAKLPDISAERDEPHRLLAKLPLSVYLTTNYDQLMFEALSGQRKNPRRDFCCWRDFGYQLSSSQSTDSEPNVANPLVFHLHGCANIPESMVLTEDDYLEFLSSLKDRRDLLPHAVTKALAGNTLLFIGYQLADWNFRIILRSLARMQRRNFAVMLDPDGDSYQVQERCRNYLAEYYRRLDIKIYWGTAKEFLRDLFERAGGNFE